MNTKVHLKESGSLVNAKGKAGVFPVRIITEGIGSSGVYSAALLEQYADAFNGAPSFMNHPLDPNRPDLRDITTIAGKIVSEVRYEERDGIAALYADLQVDERWQNFVETYADVIGLSVFIEGSGKNDDEGNFLVESFNGEDPYKSVDFVVAAGRGGRVERAMESLRVIESSVGIPASKTDSEASGQVTKEGKVQMEKEILEALVAIKESLAPVVTFINESKTAKEVTIQSEVDADALETARTEAVEAYDAKVATIPVADLLPSQVESIRAAAKRGDDVAELIAEAKKVVDEAKGLVTRSSESLRIGENAGADESYTMVGVL